MENGAAGAGAQRNTDAATPSPGIWPGDQKAAPGRDVCPCTQHCSEWPKGGSNLSVNLQWMVMQNVVSVKWSIIQT